jgi:hypothetical protein
VSRFRRVRFAVSLALAAIGWLGTARADPAPPRRVVVAGPQDDTIAPRVEKELQALGFETVRVGGLEACARSAVVVAAKEAAAVGAACSDGDQVGIWIESGGTFRLRDVVVVREEPSADTRVGGAARETTAVRAAEVTRATIAMHDAEEESSRSQSPAPPTPKASGQAPEWESFDRSPSKPTSPPQAKRDRAPTFLAGVGFSALMGVDASVAALSGAAEIGIHRYLTATARIEYPLEENDIADRIRVAPAFVGAGIGIPLTNPGSFIIPRLGAGIGVAWIRATALPGFAQTLPGVLEPSSGGSDSVASFATYASAGVSMRMYRALRLTADGVLGSTTSRLVVRDQQTHMAYWGTPFGALALRMELMFR